MLEVVPRTMGLSADGKPGQGMQGIVPTWLKSGGFYHFQEFDFFPDSKDPYENSLCEIMSIVEDFQHKRLPNIGWIDDHYAGIWFWDCTIQDLRDRFVLKHSIIFLAKVEGEAIIHSQNPKVVSNLWNKSWSSASETARKSPRS